MKILSMIFAVLLFLCAVLELVLGEYSFSMLCSIATWLNIISIKIDSFGDKETGYEEGLAKAISVIETKYNYIQTLPKDVANVNPVLQASVTLNECLNAIKEVKNGSKNLQ